LGLNIYKQLPSVKVEKAVEKADGSSLVSRQAYIGKLLDKKVCPEYSLKKRREEITSGSGLVGSFFVLRRARGSLPFFQLNFGFIKINF
jgi:hypothetical protein